MHLTAYHVRYWQARMGPQWARKHADKVSIHDCINSHAQIDRIDRTAAGNLLAILRLTRKRESLRFTLARIAVAPNCTINPRRRAAFARAWLRRIMV